MARGSPRGWAEESDKTAENGRFGRGRLEFSQIGKLVERDGGQLAAVAREHDDVAEYLVIEVSPVVQAVPASLRANDSARGGRLPLAKSHLHFVNHFHAVARLELLEDVEGLRVHPKPLSR